MPKNKKFKTYTDKGKKHIFTVFIIHGHSRELKTLQSFIENKLNFQTIILKDGFSGEIVLNKFKKAAWKADCAIALMSPDDKFDNGNFTARQNVLFEIGYCQGLLDDYYGDYYDFEPVGIIKESSIDFKEVSDLLGTECINYKKGKLAACFPTVRQYLESVYKEINE